MLDALLVAQLWTSEPELFTCNAPIQASGHNQTHTRDIIVPSDVEILQFNIQLYGIVDSYSVSIPGSGSVTEAFQAAGFHSETFPVPLDVQQGHRLRIQVVGNDNPGTAWNYTLSCLEPSVGHNEPIVQGFDRINHRPTSDGGMTIAASLIFDHLPPEDICIVERLTLEDTAGNRIALPPFPFAPNRDDVFYATWGTSDCPPLYSSQKPPSPGGISQPSLWAGYVRTIPILGTAITTNTMLGSLRDSHGTAPLQCWETEENGTYITRQRFYWYRPNQPGQLYRLRDTSGNMVETTIKRSFLSNSMTQRVEFQDHLERQLMSHDLPVLGGMSTPSCLR